MGSQYESGKYGKILEQNGLKGLQMVQFEYPRHWNPSVSYIHWELREYPISQYRWDRGVSVPWAFKLDHLQPFKPILFWNFSNFFTFILGSQFLLPQRANYGSWENFPFPNMDETEGFECLGHSNRTICSPLSQFFDFYSGEPVSR